MANILYEMRESDKSSPKIPQQLWSFLSKKVRQPKIRRNHYSSIGAQYILIADNRRCMVVLKSGGDFVRGNILEGESLEIVRRPEIKSRHTFILPTDVFSEIENELNSIQ